MGVSKDAGPDFKSQFYNLQGTHINERKKNFYRLLKSTSPDIPEDQTDIQPRNYQEKIFYVDVLIHFKRVEKLFEILKGETGVLSSKILKQHWFFREAFKNVSEENIVNNFLPTLSYSLRMKVLKKLSFALGEERMDNIFDLVLERYGLFVAKQFLFGCSSDKIFYILRNNEITLLTAQLKRLLQKDINIIKVYFEEYKKNLRKDFDSCAFLNYLVWKHPYLYTELELKTINSNIKLGRRTTLALLESNKEDVLKDIKSSRWNTAAIVKHLKQFDKEYLPQFFPSRIETINASRVESLVSKYPIKKRWEVLSQSFKQAYNKEIVEHLDSFEEGLAKFFPEEIQRQWAEIKYFNTDDLQYIKYYYPEKAVNILKPKINVTSDVKQRGKLLNELITVCYKNSDYSVYEEVLKYICARHRNDHKNVRAIMISHIGENIDYDLITETHWKHINEIIDIQRVRGESFLPFDIIAEYLLFVYKNHLSLDGPITLYVKDCIKINRSFALWDKLKKPEVESTVLKHVVKILPTLQLEDGRKVEKTFEIMSNIVDFNKNMKNDKTFNKEFKKHWINLNECPIIMDLIKEFCAKEEPYTVDDYRIVNSLTLYNCLYSEYPLKVINEHRLLDIIRTMGNDEDKGDLVEYFIRDVIEKPKRDFFESTLLDYFFRKPKDMGIYHLKQGAIKHFLAKEPEVIEEYFSEILPLDLKDHTCHTNMINYDMIKKYSHLRLDEKLIAYFKDFVSIDSKCEHKIKLLKALSIIMNTEDFLDLIKDYIPDEKKLNLNNEEERELYQVRCDIAKDFMNLDEKSLVAPVLMHFCQGDYLQSSLAALYSMLYRINEEKAFSYIKLLGGRAVSTRKHAVFLGFKLLPLRDSVTVYLTLSNKETNISAKKYLFDAVLRHFIQNPSGPLLDIVFRNMDFIDKNDTEMIQTLVDSVSNIPSKNAPLFFEKVWNFLDFLEQQEVRVIDYRCRLLNIINRHEVSFFLRLNKTFFENIIIKYFLSSDDRLFKSLTALNCFIINYLLAYVDEPHFEFVFNIIKSYKERHWKSDNKDSIIYMFNFFCDSYNKFYENNDRFLKLFTSFWQRIFSLEENFFEYVLLRLMILYKDNLNIEPFSKEVNIFFQELTLEHGPYIIYSAFVTNAIKHFFWNFPTRNNTDFDMGNFALCLLKSDSSEFNCFIAFNILRDFSSIQQNDNIYTEVIEALQAVNSFAARVYCNGLLKNK